jgi:hypothetical protein
MEYEVEDMRVDFEQMLKDLQGTELYKRFRVIAELEKYTLLTPPYTAETVKQLARDIQQELDFKLPNPYYWFMKCCDGGLLFTNQIYCLRAVNDDSDDMIGMNKLLRGKKLIPHGDTAIGETNYGAYIVLRQSKETPVALWDPHEETYIAEYEDFYAWMDDVIKEAFFLLSNDGLPEIVDDEDEADG